MNRIKNIHYVVLNVLILCSYSIMGQTVDFSIFSENSLRNNSVINNLGRFSTNGIQANYYPNLDIPLGIGFNFGYSSLLDLRHDISYNTNENYTEFLGLKYNKFSYSVGLKLINQRARTIINPYVSSQIGFSRINCGISLKKEMHNTNEEHFDIRVLGKHSLLGHYGSIYFFEGGFELSPYAKALRKNNYYRGSYIKTSITFSARYNGTIGNFKYYNMAELNRNLIFTSNPHDFELVKQEVSNTELRNTKLNFWTFAISLSVRF